MTLEESVKQQIKIMQAFIDGKDVQFREKGDTRDDWSDHTDDGWNFDFFEYRIKPDFKPKTCRFKTGDMVFKRSFEGKSIAKKGGTLITEEMIYNYEKGKSFYQPGNDLNEDYFLEDELLWYWEYIDISGVWCHTIMRETKQDFIDFLRGRAHPGSMIKRIVPLYMLGFRIPNNKNSNEE